MEVSAHIGLCGGWVLSWGFSQLLLRTPPCRYIFCTCFNYPDNRYRIVLQMHDFPVLDNSSLGRNKAHCSLQTIAWEVQRNSLSAEKSQGSPRKLLQQCETTCVLSLCVLIVSNNSSLLAIIYFCCICIRKNTIPFGYCGLNQHYSCLFPGLYKLGKSPCVQPILGVSCFNYCQGASISSLGKHIAVT